MAKTLVALYDTMEAATETVRDLQANGVARDDISVVARNAAGTGTETVTDDAGEGSASGAGAGAVGGTVLGGGLGLLVGLGALAIPGIGPVVAAGTLATVLGTTALGAGIGAAAGGLVGALVGSGVPEEDAHVYSEGVRRGGTLVTVSVADEMTDNAVAILERHEPVDVDVRGSQYRESGWQRFDESAEPHAAVASAATTTPTAATTTRQAATPRPATSNAVTNIDKDSVTLPVVEEQINVGKREVESGGVRVRTRIIETPVQEQVTLRDETVHVERRPVDRNANVPADAFTEKTIEMTETAEEAIVSKQARVVEEVTIDKDATERTETIRDTVRRQDVEVDQTGGATTSASGYDAFDSDFRTYYTSNLAKGGYTYEQYAPGFRYGYDLQSDKRYAGKQWNAIEADVRRDWESRNQGPWDQFKDSVRYAWDRATSKR